MGTRKCWVRSCQSSGDREQDKGVTFHRLPKNAVMRAKWLMQAHLSNDTDKRACFICSRHFRKADYEPYRDSSRFLLKPDSIPTIFSWGVTELEELDAIFSNKRPNGPGDAVKKTKPFDAPADSKDQESVRRLLQDNVEEKSESPDGDSPADAKETDVKDEESIEQITSFLNEENKKFESESLAQSTVSSFKSDCHSAPEIESIFENLFERENRSELEAGEKPPETAEKSPDAPTKPNTNGKINKVVDRPKRVSVGNTKMSQTKPKPKRKSVSVGVQDGDEPEKVPGDAPKSDKGILEQGCRVEAKDFGEKWYPAKVVEVDQDEEEVLIHYDNWSQRFDEWINIHSSRLRYVGPPPTENVLTYSVGERCYARWSNNQRFPATVKKVLSDGKYEVMFDDGFIRTIKSVMMSKNGSRRISTASSSPSALSPIPGGVRREGDPVTVPDEPPPPLQNHLFDPKRDHLGTKEERRNMKKRIDVKSLFSRKKNKSEKDIEADGSGGGDNRRRKRTEPDEKVLKKHSSLKTILKQRRHDLNTTISGDSLSDTASGNLKIDIPDSDGQTADGLASECPALSEKSPGHNVLEGSLTALETSVEPHGRSLIVSSPRKQSGAISPTTAEALKSKCDANRYMKGERMKSPTGSCATAGPKSVPPQHTPGPSNDPFLTLRAAESDWCCCWVNNHPVGIVLESETSSDPLLNRYMVRVEDKRLPPGWSKILSKKNASNMWEVILVCPSGRRYKSRREMQERLKEKDQAELAPYAVALMDFSAHRKQARRCGLDNIDLETLPPEIQNPSVNSSPYLNTIHNSDGSFVYIGSLKVQIIENLLRCPQEGCLKNFRKENLLQMHIKHYHRDLCKYFGDTPNVADLAYARTVVEESVPSNTKTKPDLDRSLGRSKDKRFGEIQNVDVKTENVDFENYQYDNSNHETAPSKTPDSGRKLGSESFLKIALSTDQSGNSEYRIVPKEEPGVFSQWNFNKQKSPSSYRDAKSGYNHSKSGGHKNHHKGAYVENSQSPKFYPSCEDEYSIDTYKKSSKKRSLDGSYEHKSKKKANFEAWNSFTPTFDETRSSFGIADKNSMIVNTNFTLDDQKIKGDMRSEKEDTNQSMIITESGEKIKIVHMKREEIINCRCGFSEEDGLMIQCDLCLCWQHALCHSIERESEVPEKYICYICQNPQRGRRSQKYLFDQDWLYEGRLPRSSSTERPSDEHRANLLRKSHELTGNLLQLKELLHSLRCKMEVAEKKDHPKLYLWSKSWEENETSLVPCKSRDNSDENLYKNSDICAMDIKTEEVETEEVIIPKVESEDSLEEPDAAIPEEAVARTESDETDSLNNKTEPIEAPEMVASREPTIEPEIPDAEKVTCKSEAVEAESAAHSVTAESVEEILKEQLAAEIVSANGDISLMNPDCGDLKMQPGDTKCELVNGASPASLENLLTSSGSMALDIPIPMTSSDLESFAKSIPIPVAAPQPEALIESSDCRLRLLQHIEKLHSLLEARLDSIESQIAELESQDPMFDFEETADHYPRTKQTIQMLLRDLSTLEELGTTS